jgi:hypothetical protein
MLGGVFYGGLVAALLGSGFDLWVEILPAALAGPMTRNSEGLLLAVLLCAWLEVAGPRLAEPGKRRWHLTVAAASACVLVAVGLLWLDLPDRLRTLNESFLAAAVLLPMLQVRRLPPIRFGVLASLAVVCVVVLTSRLGVVVHLAEALGAIALAPFGFWVVDRSLLDQRATPAPTSARIAWYACLLLLPVGLSGLASYDVDGPVGELADYGVRTLEAFVFMLLVPGYFACRRCRERPRLQSDRNPAPHRV